MKIKDFINGRVSYDREGQYFCIVDSDGHFQLLGEMRGWGHIQNMFKDRDGNIDMKEAGKYQDKVGEWVAEAINEKMERERSVNSTEPLDELS